MVDSSATECSAKSADGTAGAKDTVGEGFDPDEWARRCDPSAHDCPKCGANRVGRSVRPFVFPVEVHCTCLECWNRWSTRP